MGTVYQLLFLMGFFGDVFWWFFARHPRDPGTHPLSSSPMSRIADHLPQIVGTDASENWGHLSDAANSMVPGYLKDRGQRDVNG